MNLKSLASSGIVSALTLAAGAALVQPERASAVDLNFSDPVGVADIPNTLNRGDGYSSSAIRFNDIAPGVSGVYGIATATVTGTDYSFLGHYPKYAESNGTTEPNDDLATRYQIAPNSIGLGTMNYQLSLFNNSDNTPFVAPELRFLVYDVDGEASQGEAIRINKNSGLVGYQVGSSPQALRVTQDTNSFLFSGRDVNVDEFDSSGAAILYFQNVSSVLFQFEADTRTPISNSNVVFSAIDGDLSYLSSFTGGFNPVTIPEPFTVIGSIIGGAAALRLRKKLKADKTAK